MAVLRMPCWIIQMDLLAIQGGLWGELSEPMV